MLRDLLLTNLDGQAKAGFVPQALIDKIRRGHGLIDPATDCIELAAAYGTYAAVLRGKTPVTAAQVTETADVGNQLRTLLKPRTRRRSVRRKK